jgi:hypothetical protein
VFPDTAALAADDQDLRDETPEIKVTSLAPPLPPSPHRDSA